MLDPITNFELEIGVLLLVPLAFSTGYFWAFSLTSLECALQKIYSSANLIAELSEQDIRHFPSVWLTSPSEENEADAGPQIPTENVSSNSPASMLIEEIARFFGV
ncbi:MAG: hypothetical protein IPK29_10765 [Betaproteobacteria bacterium]|nr:hypothetical protein [Betaproteobacteria bacterium]